MTRRGFALLLIGVGSGLIGPFLQVFLLVAVAFVFSIFSPSAFIVGVRVDSELGWALFALPFVLVLLGVLLLWRSEKTQHSN